MAKFNGELPSQEWFDDHGLFPDPQEEFTVTLTRQEESALQAVITHVASQLNPGGRICGFSATQLEELSDKIHEALDGKDG